MEERRAGRSFRERMQDINAIDIKDFNNPWNYYGLMLNRNEEVYEWLSVGNCGGVMSLKKPQMNNHL